MIASILFFSLGFLTAALLALMIAPALWRRAVRLTRRRIEASVPLSANEIQADKDRLRAEFAMSTRRLEMGIKEFKEKAATQIVEIGRHREELKRLAGERDEKNASISALEARGEELSAALQQREDELLHLSEGLAAKEKQLQDQTREIGALGRTFSEISMDSSNRQIELVARETEVEKLAGDLSILRNERKELDRHMRELGAEHAAVEQALEMERRRTAELEEKLKRSAAMPVDGSSGQIGSANDQPAAGDLAGQLSESEKRRAALESDLAGMSAQLNTLLSGAKADQLEKAMEKLDDERERLEQRLLSAARENKKLRADLAAHERARSADWNDERRESAVLREQINDLAAEVVHLTMTLDGPDSPIRKALTVPAPDAPATNGEAAMSLADRIRALQQAAEAR